MYTLPKPVAKLIAELSKLPGVGPKTASRLAFYLIRNPQSQDAAMLGEALLKLKDGFDYCSICHNITSDNPCDICADSNRDASSLCIVEEPLDMIAIEKSRSFKGRYHILGGRLSPLDGINPEDLHLNDLLDRIEKEKIEEIVIATNHNVEGEATAMYITKMLLSVKIRITRIASGLPMGGDLEYADEVTLAKALEGRRSI